MTGNSVKEHKIRHHSFSLKGITPKVTPEGFYLFENVKVARTGLFPWMVAELEQDGILNSLPSLQRSETVQIQRDSFSQEAIDSLSLKPLTNDHPSNGLVTPVNASKNIHGAMGNAFIDDEWLKVDKVIVYTQEAKDALESGKVEVSIGYTYKTPVEWLKDLPYVAKEVIICINHVAIVVRGRAGPECRLNEQEHEMENEKLDQLTSSIEQFKTIAASLSLRLNALEAAKNKEDSNVTISSNTTEEASKNELSKEKETPGGQENSGSKETGISEGGESGERKNSSEKSVTTTEGSKEQSQFQEQSKRGNEGEKVMNDKINDEMIEEYARKNDLFILNSLDMQALLKQVSVNGLIGFKNGKEFTSKDKTRINMQSFSDIIDSEIASRKIQEEAEQKTSRINNSSEIDLCDAIGI